MWLRISPGKTPAAASAMYPSSRLTAVVPLLTALVGLAPDLASGAHHRRTSLHTTSECVDIESCAACAEAGCAFASDTCTAGPSSDLGVCCDEDTSKAKGASWLCDDGCNTCSCDHTGAISAKGCEIMSNEQQPESLDSELVLVVLVALHSCLPGHLLLVLLLPEEGQGPVAQRARQGRGGRPARRRRLMPVCS